MKIRNILLNISALPVVFKVDKKSQGYLRTVSAGYLINVSEGVAGGDRQLPQFLSFEKRNPLERREEDFLLAPLDKQTGLSIMRLWITYL